MQPNRALIIGGMVIISVGVIHAAVQSKPETPVFAGGVVFLLLASLLDALGGGASKVATGLVSVAAVTVVLTEGSAVIQAAQAAQKNINSTEF